MIQKTISINYDTWKKLRDFQTAISKDKQLSYNEIISLLIKKYEEVRK